MLKYYLILIAICSALFLPMLDIVHLFDWDEINFAEAAREMLLTHNFSRVQINFLPFWEKPPLFIWMQALCMQLFGVGDYAARLPNALAGIITICLLFNIGSKIKDIRLGFIWAIVYLGTLLPTIYFKSGIIDPIFNLFIFAGLYQYSKLLNPDNRTNIRRIIWTLSGAILIGLAVLTKGPVAILISVLTILIVGIYTQFRCFLTFFEVLLSIFIGLLVISAWFLPETLQNGTWFIQSFIEYQIRLFNTQDAGHGGPFYYHIIVLLIGCFPASIFFLSSLKKDFQDDNKYLIFKTFNIVLFFVVLVLFSIVKTKIVHYSSLCWFPLSFLCAYYFEKLLFTGKFKVRYIHLFVLLIIGIALSVILFAVPFLNEYKPQILPKIKDTFAQANLTANMYWNPLLSLTGVLFLLICIFSTVFLLKVKFQVLGFALLFIGTLVCAQLIMYNYVPNIEGYSQRAAIEFYQKYQGQAVLIEPLGFKSYAHLYYAQKPLPLDSAELNSDLIKSGKIKTDKQIYYVSKINYEREVLQDTMITKLYEKNGFVFYKRVK
jgi:4-amino-4-deoxy-L-arabinose transferase-like glycosyltransferase